MPVGSHHSGLFSSKLPTPSPPPPTPAGMVILSKELPAANSQSHILLDPSTISSIYLPTWVWLNESSFQPPCIIPSFSKNHHESYPFSNTWPKLPLLHGTVVDFSPEMLMCSASEFHLQYVTLAAWNCHHGKWKLEIGKQCKSGLVLVLRDGCFHFSSVTQLCPTLCDPMDFSISVFPVINNPLSMLKLKFIKSVMPSNHLILCRPLLLLPSIFRSIRIFSNESALHIRWSKSWSFSFNMSFQWKFRTDFLQDWLVWFPCSPRDSQESSPTPQFKSINSSVLSFLYSPTFTSIHDHWKNHSLD